MRWMIFALTLASCSAPTAPALDAPSAEPSRIASIRDCPVGYRLEPLFPGQAEPATCAAVQ